MASNFSKEERVLFDTVVAKFEDGEVLAKAVRKANIASDMKAMERQNNVVLRRVPYILKGNSVQDQTGLFGGVTQMTVPVSLSYRANQPLKLEQNEIRDMDQLQWLSEAAVTEIGSQINVAVTNAICNLGSIVIKQTTAPTGFADLSLANARMTQRGIVGSRRVAGIEPDHYRQMASDLAQRQVLQSGKTLTAYEQAYIGKIAMFDTIQLEYSKLIPAKTAVGVTLTSASSHYVPKATSTASTGEVQNVDNRFQVIGITVTSGTVAVGDAFYIANMSSVHNITKQSTGQPMTHRVTKIVTGGGGTGTIEITPPIINAAGGSTAEKQYQNCTGTLAAGAAITFLNTVTSNALPFFDERCIELLPGQLPVNENSGIGQMKYTTSSGVSILFSKQSDIETRGTKYLWETFFGVGVLNTEMCGIILFNQT